MAQLGETDLPPNLACLKNIDTLLRCPICFDYMNISMMTQCSHNFCSLCIRKFLSYKLLCPLCNTPVTEQELRNNRLLDDLVQSFQAARQQLSQTNFESPPISPKTPTMAVGGKEARQRALKKESNTMTHFFQKRASVNSSTGAQSSCKGVQPVTQEPMEVCVQGALLPDSAMTVTRALKEKKQDVPVFPSTSQDIKPVLKVDCPVCGVEVSQQHINKHLDTCLTREEKKDSLRRSDQIGLSGSACVEPNSRKRRPMAKLVYTLLTMVELKRRLRDCHLSTQGSREQLVRRHQEFTHIYNSQCDAFNPRSIRAEGKHDFTLLSKSNAYRKSVAENREELAALEQNLENMPESLKQLSEEVQKNTLQSEDIAREVENNEKMRNRLASKRKPAILITRSHTSDEIEQLHSDYRKQHNVAFSRLIAQVKGRLENSKKTQIKQEEEKSEEASCCSDDDTVVQNTTQPPVSCSSTLEISNKERTPVLELRSRSPSPALSEVSVSRARESPTEKRKI